MDNFTLESKERLGALEGRQIKHAFFGNDRNGYGELVLQFTDGSILRAKADGQASELFYTFAGSKPRYNNEVEEKPDER